MVWKNTVASLQVAFCIYCSVSMCAESRRLIVVAVPCVRVLVAPLRAIRGVGSRAPDAGRIRASVLQRKGRGLSVWLRTHALRAERDEADPREVGEPPPEAREQFQDRHERRQRDEESEDLESAGQTEWLAMPG
jgi:hypothetical protein